MPSFLQELLEKFKLPISILLVGLSFLGIGIFLSRTNSSNDSFAYNQNSKTPTSSSSPSLSINKIVVEISGQIQNPGVYELSSDARVNDLIIKSGGFTNNADLDFISKNLNKASKLVDGQKIFIPSVHDSDNEKYTNQETKLVLGSTSQLVNINTATQSQLESLPKIGQVYAQKIIEQRPYSSIEELKNNKIIPEKAYESIKDLISTN